LVVPLWVELRLDQLKPVLVLVELSLSEYDLFLREYVRRILKQRYGGVAGLTASEKRLLVTDLDLKHWPKQWINWKHNASELNGLSDVRIS